MSEDSKETDESEEKQEESSEIEIEDDKNLEEKQEITQMLEEGKKNRHLPLIFADPKCCS